MARLLSSGLGSLDLEVPEAHSWHFHGVADSWPGSQHEGSVPIAGESLTLWAAVKIKSLYYLIHYCDGLNVLQMYFQKYFNLLKVTTSAERI